MQAPVLNIVVPCYNEEEVFPETARTLVAVLSKLNSHGKIHSDSCVVFVDDGSTDDTWGLIEKYAKTWEHVQGIKLSRNRGHQHALLAGLHAAKADLVVSIDADLQDDPTVIADMVDAYLSGHDVVYGVRSERRTDSFFKRFTAEGYYKVLRWMGVEVVFNHADYRLLSRRALDALKHYDEVNLFLRGVVPTLGFPSTVVEYERSERFAGESKYPLRKMLSLALEGVTSFSAVPLRLVAWLGVLVFSVSVLLTGWALWVRTFSEESVPGWASSVIPTYFLGGLQLLSIGVLGEYLGKIYAETKRRPRFIIEDVVGPQDISQPVASERRVSRIARRLRNAQVSSL